MVRLEHAPWLTITSAASGSGTAHRRGSARRRSRGRARTGALTIGGQTFTVTQAGVCTFAIAPERVRGRVGAAASSHIDAVTAPAGCAWSSSSQRAVAHAARIGARKRQRPVQVTVAENKGAARAGTATIAGRTADGQSGRGAVFVQALPNEKTGRTDRVASAKSHADTTSLECSRMATQHGATDGNSADGSTSASAYCGQVGGTRSAAGPACRENEDHSGRPFTAQIHDALTSSRYSVDARAAETAAMTTAPAYLMSISSTSKTSMPCGCPGCP